MSASPYNAIVRLVSLVIAYLAFTGITQLAFLGIVRSDHLDVVERVGQGYQELIDAADRVFSNDSGITQLQSQSAMGCDARVLTQLREISARESAFAYVGIVEGNRFVCDSLRGVSEFREIQGQSGSVLKQGILMNQQVESALFPDDTTVVLTKDKVALLANPYRLLPYEKTGKTHIEYILDNGESVTFLGDTDIPTVGFMYYPFSADYRFRSCLPGEPLCITSYWTNDQLWQKYQLIILGKVIIDLLLVALSVLTVNWYLRLQAKPKQRLLKALKKQQSFYFVRQPIVSLASEEIVGFEILVRFKDRYGELSPATIIPLIRELEHTQMFTYMMLDQVLSNSAMQAIPSKQMVHFNLFPEDIDFLDEDLIDRIVADSGVRARVCFEITEDHNFDASDIESRIESLNQRGYGVSIDDFGTGYSNLGKLNQFAVESLKIDQSFVRGIEEDGLLSCLIPEIIAIARRLNVSIIAEGVENESQARLLMALGIEMAQGWYYGRPEVIPYQPSLNPRQKSVGHSLITGYNAR